MSDERTSPISYEEPKVLYLPIKTMARNAYFRVMIPAVAMLTTAWIFAGIIMNGADLHLGHIILAYVFPASATVIVTTLLWLLIKTIRFARLGIERPITQILKHLNVRIPFLLVPALIMPLFLAAFTTAKSGIGFIEGYHWDHALMELDEVIFFVDPWRITHALFGSIGAHLLEALYGGWGIVLVFAQATIALSASSRKLTIYYSAMMLTWLFAGVVLAYGLSSVGPAMDYAINPALGHHFAELVSSLPADSVTRLSQLYLVDHLNDRVVAYGGGISAMPSMHVATTVIYVLAARKTIWFWPAALFAVLIWISSIYLGFHYAVDGPVGALAAYFCWHTVEQIQRRVVPILDYSK